MWSNITYFGHVIWTTSFSMSSANPFSKGSAIIVSLFLYKYQKLINEHDNRSYLLFGVIAKHFKDDVSTTVSQNATTGSATLISNERGKTH